MAKYKPKDLKTKTTDELKEQLKLLRKNNLIFDFKLVMDKAGILPGSI